MNPPDKKALKILFDTYDWKKRFDPKTGKISDPVTNPDDFEYGKKAGVMFSPVCLSHDATIEWVVRGVKSVAVRDVSNAFLASLSTRRLNWRSALAGYAWGLRVQPHSVVKPPVGWFTQGSEWFSCAACRLSNYPEEYDLSEMNYTRLQYGSVSRMYELAYAAFFLEQFSKEEKITPIKEDYEIFNAIVGTIKSLPKNSRARDIEKSIAKLFKSSSDERVVLVETLGFCSILETPDHKGYFEDFFPRYNTNPPPRPHTNDWRYPVSWWRGEYGVNNDALDYFFSQQQIKK